MTRSWICAGLLVLSAPATAAPPIGAIVPRLDAHAHPLPPGAVARFGDHTRRFSHANRYSFSPDGRLIARSRQSGIDVRETDTGRDVTPPHFRKLDGWVEFLSDGRLAHWGGSPSRCRLIDYHTGREVADVSVPDMFGYHTLTPVAGGRGLVVMGWGRQGQGVALVGSLADPAGPKPVLLPNAWGIAASADGRYAAVVTHQWAIQLYDLPAARLLGAEQLPHPGGHPTLAAAPDGSAFYLARGRELVRLTPSPTGFEFGDSIPIDPVVGLKFAPDGRTVFGLDWSGVRKVEIGTGKVLHQWTPGPGHHSITLSPDCRRVVSNRQGETLTRVHDLESGRELFAYDELRPVQRLGWLHGGRLASWDAETVQVRDPVSGELLAKYPIPGASHDRRLFALSADGSLAAVQHPPAGPGCPVAVHQLATGKELWRADSLFGGPTGFSGMDGAFSPDGSLLSVNGRDLYAARTGRVIVQTATPGRWPSPAAFAPDGRLLASGWSLPCVVTEVATRTPRHQLPFPPAQTNPFGQQSGGITRLRFSRDGRYLVGFGASVTVVWSLDEGRAVHTDYWNGGNSGLAGAADISPDGRWLADAMPAGRLRVKDWAADPSRTRDVSVQTGQDAVTDALFTPDGKHLLTAGQDGTVLVWDMAWVARAAAVRPERRTDDELWDDLASRDAAAAGRAVAEWVRRPAAAVDRFRREIPPTKAPDPAAVATLVARLDHEKAATRDAAEAELAALAELAADALHPVAERSESAEQRTRARRLLDRLGGVVTDPPRLRAVRAVEVVERIGSPDARRLLADWAAGASGALLTRETQVALDRLAER